MYLRVCWTLNHIFLPVCLGLELQGSEAGGCREWWQHRQSWQTLTGDSRALVYASSFYLVAGVVAELLGVMQAQCVPRGR